LGEIEVHRGRRRLELPPSKKTRALLALLVLSGRRWRRERLCSMFWDVADDPRAALRWSISKLRSLTDDPSLPRIVSDGEFLFFESKGCFVDIVSVRDLMAQPVEELSVADLEGAAGEFRGELLEGLELPDFFDFQAWAVAEREGARQLHAQILQALLERLSAEPDRALPHARVLVEIDPFNETARAALVRLLLRRGRRSEAEQHVDTGSRLLEEAGVPLTGELRRAWQERAEPAADVVPAASVPSTGLSPPEPATDQPVVDRALVGRSSEQALLLGTLERVVSSRRAAAVLLSGEPGIGKTRLLATVMEIVRGRGGTVLDGASYEAESAQPYGPWIDALGRVPAVAVGDTLGGELAPLFPELGFGAGTPPPQFSGDGTPPPHSSGSGLQHWLGGGERQSRERLFGAVVDLIAARAHSAAPVLLAFDDVQWCDQASAELLHYVARMCRHRPLLVLLAARAGELADNEALQRVLRGLRHDRALEEIDLGPLDQAATRQLVDSLGGAGEAERIYRESAGNPLFAIELARHAASRSEVERGGDLPTSLGRLVRDRVAGLPADCTEVLRWGAVSGHTFDAERLGGLLSLTPDALLAALEILEHHALLRVADYSRERGGTYAFAHDVVRQAVYGEISEPRRRLMHLRIARAIGAVDDPDGVLASELAHHAGLAGDADMATRACVAAGRRCLRLFAGADADQVARRGLRWAEGLAEPERIKRQIELQEICFAARAPSDPSSLARTLEELAQRALDHACLEHARLGFHLLSYLRWEGGEWREAQRQMMRAEQIGRSAEGEQRAVAVAEAARCLILLERDLPHAEALLMEAQGLSQRLGIEPLVLSDALGMLRLREGKLEEAAELFRREYDRSRSAQDHVAEFRALENLVLLELERQDSEEAGRLAADLERIAGRLRGGSELPAARALVEVCRYAGGQTEDPAALDEALTDLRGADAKQRLVAVLLRAAEVDLARGHAEAARQRAEEAVRLAQRIERPSDVALARVTLVRAARALEDWSVARAVLAEIDARPGSTLSMQARLAAERLRPQDTSEKRARKRTSRRKQ
jgi:DNA-binding SARP family transcriptional activator/tetratricopeptide (TPR) repeat protein